MKKKMFSFWFVLVILGGLFPVYAKAEWTSVSTVLPESDIRWAAPDFFHPKTMFAASEHRVYKTLNNGNSWTQIFSLWGFSNQVRSVYPDPFKSGRIYITATNGVWVSENSGKNWNLFFQGQGGESKDVFCAVVHPSKEEEVWLGTAAGLFVVNSHSGEVTKAASFPNIPTYSILIINTRKILISALDGVYQSVDCGKRWERILVFSAAESEGSSSALQEMGMEEMSAPILPPNLIYQPSRDVLIAPTPRGFYKNEARDLSWRPIETKGVFAGKINYICASAKFFYVATDKGVYRWDPQTSVLDEISDGLDSPQTRMIFYDSRKEQLVAATKRGIYQYYRPDQKKSLQIPPIETHSTETNSVGLPTTSKESTVSVAPIPSVAEILKSFENEPTIGEIQKAAIEYAEVHPRKIQEWRSAASKKAWFPTLSFSQKASRANNVDIDRGGTADPDKFIKGPDDTSGDRSVNVSWDFGEVIWNNDQTSIDSRSKLMAELRDDVLNEVTHLYFERRRLQVDKVLNPATDATGQVEKQLRLDELTADIDGLTGGYLSMRLKHALTAPLDNFKPSRTSIEPAESESSSFTE